MKTARMLGAFGLLLLFAAISMGAGNSPRIGVGGVIGAGGVGPQSVPGFVPMQRGSVGEVYWTINSPEFREGLVRELLTDSSHVGNLDYQVIDWLGTTGTVGGKQYTASLQPKLATSTGYITFDGSDDTIGLNATSTVSVTWAFKFKRANTEVNFGSLAKGGTTTAEIYAAGLDLGNNGITGYVCSFAADINSRYQTVVFSFDETNSKILAHSEVGPKETSTPALASTVVDFSDLALSVSGSKFKGEMVGVWAWSDVKTAAEISQIYQAVSAYSPTGIFPNIASSTMTVASAAFRSDLNREFTQGNWNLNGSQLDQWYDSSGYGNGASQTTAINQPTLVGSYPYFDGSNDQLNFSTTATNTSWAFKFARQNPADEGGTLVVTWDATIIENYLTECTSYKSGVGNVRAPAANSTGTQTYILVNDQANQRWIQVTNSGVNITPFVNAPTAGSLNGRYLGNSGVGWFFKGQIIGVWSWNKALSITEAYEFHKAIKENYNP